MKRILLALTLALTLVLSACGLPAPEVIPSPIPETVDLTSMPEFSGEAFVELNGNVPFFTKEEITTEAFETYSELDLMGRCGVTVACIGTELMPTEERGSIGQVKPSGWQTVKFDVVDGKYLYNRCHLIGFQLTGENANEKNLITGTRFLNVEGMLPFENMVADYLKETGNHVMYRVTPVFRSTEKVARGVVMEALSVEDGGEGISFCVYCYNSQPGVEIDYFDGTAQLSEETPSQGEVRFILNTSSKKIHKPTCDNAGKMSDKNRKETSASLSSLLSQGYTQAGCCF
ncbi:MAG: DNA/RNA non-specific endonuclease [Clostridia bacterium]|nr:DNA/RNA non-specific endonuclease [Clostridia bacterium]